MKKFVLIISFLFIALTQNAQTELWGMTIVGGQDDRGVIYKTDASGNNQTIEYNFSKAHGHSPFYTNLIQATNGKLYGMNNQGGASNNGVIFEYDPQTDAYLNKFDFLSGVNGYDVQGSLIQSNNGLMYGMTSYGGTNNMGIIFQYDPVLNIFNKLIDFDGILNGGNPYGSLVQTADGLLHGMTKNGGTNNMGVIFSFDPTNNTIIKRIDFDGLANGQNPLGNLIIAPDGNLYGLTSSGGINNMGILFQYNPSNNVFTKKKDFVSNDGIVPRGSLLVGANGKLYGMTSGGGSYNYGVLFEFEINTDIYTKKFDFDGFNHGGTPFSSLIQASDGNIYGMTYGGGSNSTGSLFQYDPIGGALVKKLSFTGDKGEYPFGALMQASDGKLYGMTHFGGSEGKGVIFQYDISTSSYLKKFDFDSSIDGQKPFSKLVVTSNGNLYGTAMGGKSGQGVIFQFDPNTHIYTKKVEFDGPITGRFPTSSLTLASNGNFYGLTSAGGVYNGGTLYMYNPLSNTLTKLVDFNPNLVGGPPSGSLMLATDGKLYGMTKNGLNVIAGILFQYDISSNIFSIKSGLGGGVGPLGSLVQAIDGKIYGMTHDGGFFNQGILFQYDINSDLFVKKIDFQGSINGGGQPSGSLIQSSDGKLYGMTGVGGANNNGILFQYDFNTDSLKIKHDFITLDGGYPTGSLLQALNGNFYGITNSGGVNNKGVLFQYNPIADLYTKKMDFNGTNGRFLYFVTGNDLIQYMMPVNVIKENINSNNIILYPNPNNGSFSIDLKTKSQIIITNTLGETILNQSLEIGKQNLTIQSQADGIYFVKVTDDKGLSSTKKIVVQK